ncbi:hypothetical protein FHL15_007675 [Xylaria flabelliformis]|uniref:Fungal N-terminal domain-containing protein n=1 Tax=Xylaria flabelliformis TaxID=2512241 RepID=A0A553HU38_9PEZI|nr:hypothetical protein FHL15_007675 [Xylaria flabelliformis]
MVDPLSVATGAAGIISLGIQVCGGLSDYLSAVKHKNEELAAVWGSARTQAANFEFLNEFIIRIRAERPEDADYLLQRLEDARGPLHKLRDLVATLAGLPLGMIPTLQNTTGSSLSTITKSTSSLKERARDVGRAMTYKFHQDNLKNLQWGLQLVSMSLHTAMLNVILNDNEKHGQDVKSLQTIVLSVGLKVESKGADIFSAIASLASQNQAMVSIAQQNEAKLCEIQNSQGLLKDEYAQVLPILAELKSIARRLDRQNQHRPGRTEPRQIANQVVQSLPPALTKHALDIYSGCGCRASIVHSSTSSLKLRNFSVFSRKQTQSRHERSCPLHAVTREYIHAIGARVCLRLGSFLNCLVEANLWCTMGQGGYSLGPSVRWKNVVPRDQSPVQVEFDRIGSWLMSGPSGQRAREEAEVVDRLKTMKENVLTLYKKGQASINDVDQSSNNHLQNFVDLLVRSLNRDLLTREVVDAAISVIRFYIETGLTCDERDTHFVTRAIASQWGFLPSLGPTFTTLAKSADFLLPSGRKATYQSFRLVSFIARASDPVVEDVVQMIPYTDPGLFFTQIVDHETCIEKISPVAKAILIRSLKDLESAIKLSPELLLEKSQGLTVLHLSIGWPPGLSLLLRTTAKFLLDTPDDISKTPYGRANLAWPFSYAAANHCAQSLDLVLQAGCNLYPEYSERGMESSALSCALEVTSAECAEVFARHMALRRQELFALARLNIDKIMLSINHLSIREDARKAFMMAMAANEHYADPRQARPDAMKPAQSEHVNSNIVVWALKHADIPLPVSLRPSGLADHDVYQLPGLPLAFFPIFERHGFAGYNEPNRYGLRPIMDDLRSSYCLSKAGLGEEIQGVLPWLIQHGCLDARPAHNKEQPQSSVMIDTGVTGWHYLSMEFVHRAWGLQGPFLLDFSISPISEANMDLMATIAEGQAKHCTDYCHYLFRHGRNGGDIIASASTNEGNLAATRPTPAWQLEFLRLLTFEALEITHTCCTPSLIWSNGIGMAIFAATTDPEAVQRQLLEDPSVQDKVRLLDELMTEFTEQLTQRAGSPRDLEDFVFGPWRARMAGLYGVDAEEVNTMERVLGGKVRTKVLPEPVARFFGKEFPFFDDRPGLTKEKPSCAFCF